MSLPLSLALTEPTDGLSRWTITEPRSSHHRRRQLPLTSPPGGFQTQPLKAGSLSPALPGAPSPAAAWQAPFLVAAAASIAVAALRACTRVAMVAAAVSTPSVSSASDGRNLSPDDERHESPRSRPDPGRDAGVAAADASPEGAVDGPSEGASTPRTSPRDAIHSAASSARSARSLKLRPCRGSTTSKSCAVVTRTTAPFRLIWPAISAGGSFL